MDISLGDWHEVGKSIICIDTTIGKFIYKPRNAVIESCLLRVLKVINSIMERPANIGIPSFLDKHKYSWHEYIDATPPTSIHEVYEYYNGIGCLLYIAYSLYGYDFHFENIIIQGSTPYVIDAECLFVNIKKDDENFFSESVLNTCVIPSLNATERDIFRCGIGLHDESKNTFETMELEQSPTGEIFQKKVIGHVNRYFNSPDINLEGIDFNIIKNNISESFSKISLSMELKIKDISNIISSELNLSCRILFRSSKEYAKMLFLSKHPRFSMNEIDREMLFSTLLYKEKIPKFILKEEFYSLMEGRIPLFTLLINKDVLSVNNKKIPIIKNDLFNDVYSHLRKANDNVSFQKQLIEISLETIFPKEIKTGVVDVHDLNEVLNFILQEKVKVQDKLVRLNLKTSQHGYKAIVHSEKNIYSGLCGILFLKICWFILKKIDKEIDIIQENFKKIFNEIESQDVEKNGYEAFESLGSLLYIAYLISKHISNEYIEHFEIILDKILVRILKEDTPYLDIISGVSGVLIICCRMYQLEPRKTVYSSIKTLTDIIITHSILINDTSITWEKKYTGFAHGNSGILYSLALSNEIFFSKNIALIIHKAIVYEQEQKIPSGWRDFRNNDKDEEIDFNSWCHGATGIYMVRKALLQEAKRIPSCTVKLIHDDVVHYTKSREFSKINYHKSLCHGVYGNAIIESSMELIDDCHEQFLFDKLNPSEEKSLMIGTLGRYYAFLKISDKDNILPNLLLLQ